MKIYIAVALLFLTNVCFSQCPINKPDWADDGVLSLSNSIVKPFYAKGHSLKEAQDNVERQKMEERARLVEQRVKVNDNATSYSSDFAYSASNVVEYSEMCSEEYHYWQMAQIVVNMGVNSIPEKVSYTDKYPFSPRVFVSGMAQLHKGSTAKGVFFIVGEIALLGGVVACEGLRASYDSKISITHNAQDRRTYISNADNLQNLRNGFIAGAVALYAWNVIDGMVAKGKKHVVLGSSNLRFAPYVSSQSNGVVLSYKF